MQHTAMRNSSPLEIVAQLARARTSISGFISLQGILREEGGKEKELRQSEFGFRFGKALIATGCGFHHRNADSIALLKLMGK